MNSLRQRWFDILRGSINEQALGASSLLATRNEEVAFRAVGRLPEWDQRLAVA
jgi:hypothetical protein